MPGRKRRTRQVSDKARPAGAEHEHDGGGAAGKRSRAGAAPGPVSRGGASLHACGGDGKESGEKGTHDVGQMLKIATEQLARRIRHLSRAEVDDVPSRTGASVKVRMQRSRLGWDPGDDLSMDNMPRCAEEAVAPAYLLQPHLCRTILQGVLERDGLVPDAIQCDERLMHMVSHIVREHGVIVIKSPVVQQMHVVEVTDVSITPPEGKQSRNYVCPMTATEATLTRNSYQVTVLVNIRHSVYVPRPGHRVEGLQSARTGGARTSQTICTSIPSMDNPGVDVLADTDDPRASISLWSSCAAAGRLRFEPPPGYKLVSVKLLTNHVLTTLTAAVGGAWCHLSSGPTRDTNEMFELGVRRVVKGQSKILLQQEQPAFNFITVHPGLTGKATWVASLRARLQSKMRSTSTTYVFVRCGDQGTAADVTMWCTLPYVKLDIPPLALLRILGVPNAQVAARMVASGGMTSGTDEPRPGSMFASPATRALEAWVRSVLLTRRPKDSFPDLDTATENDIMVWIAQSGTTNTRPEDCIRHVRHLIANEFMPCMGLSSDPLALARKARMLAFMMYRIARVVRGEEKPDNRDHCGNKQVDGAADLLAQLIRQQHRNVVRSFAAHARAQIDASAQLDVARSFNGRRIGDHEAYSLSTGNWGLQKGGSTQKGAAQHQSRQGFACTVSQLRRISMQVDRKGKHAMPRQVSITAWGFICPVESPEGHACGLVKALALLARICPSRPFGVMWTAVRRALGTDLTKLGEEPPGFSPGASASLLWLNGVMCGTVRHGEHARRLLVEERRRHALPHDAEIFLSATGKELYVVAEAGGLRRPLIILEPPYKPVPDPEDPARLMPPPPLSADEAREAAERRLSAVRDLMHRMSGKSPSEIVSALLYEGCVEYVGPREVDNLVIKMWAAKDDEAWEEDDRLLQEWGSDDEDEPGAEEDGSGGDGGGGGGDEEHHDGLATEAGLAAVARLDAMRAAGPGALGVRDDGHDPVMAPRPGPDAGADEEEAVDVAPLHLVDSANRAVRCSIGQLEGAHVQEARDRATRSIDEGEPAALWAAVERRAVADAMIERASMLVGSTARVVPSLLVPEPLRASAASRDDEDHWRALREHVRARGTCDGFDAAARATASESPARASAAGKKRRAATARIARAAASSQPEPIAERHRRPTDAEVRAARRLYVKADRARRRHQLAVVETEAEARRLWEMGLPEEQLVRFYAGRMRARANRARADARRKPCLSRWQAAPYTHAEIHPTAMYGFTTSLLVLFEHNQAPRNAYADAMIKAAQGVMRDRNLTRGSTSMWYPQRPIVASHASRIFGMDRHASGANPMIAVLSDMGDNQEDSKIHNQNSIDSGLNRTAIHRAYVEEAREGFSADSQRFKLPGPDCLGVRAASYDHIDPATAAVVPGQVVRGGDALICKVMLVGDIDPGHHGGGAGAAAASSNGGGAAAGGGGGGKGKIMRERDQSVIARATEGASVVEAVLRTQGRDGKSYVVVATREMRIPQRGDKTTNRHGQKGVMSVIMPPDDLPYTEDGVTPDVVLNPHAIPSRMTCGMFFEMMAAKVGVLEGIVVDGSAHDTPVTPETLAEVLRRNGYRCDGEQVMYSGRTGRPLRGYVAMGPSHEHRLRQMVKDKIATRETGPVTPLNGQAVEGRSRYGGLRVGEMERDCLIAHGASAVILDRLLEQSDDSIGAVCKKCGLLAISSRARMPHASVESSGPMCLNCGTGEHVRSVRFPKAWKVLMQEMMSMNVRPSLVLEDDASIDYGSSASVGLQVPPSGEVRVPLIRRGTASTVAPAAGAGHSRSARAAGAAVPSRGAGGAAAAAAAGRDERDDGGCGEGWGRAIPPPGAETFEAVAEATRINEAQAAAALAESAGAAANVPQ